MNFKKIFFILLCVFSTNIFSQSTIDPNSIKNIAYILADPKGLSRSIGGHSYLRLMLDEKGSIADYVVGFSVAGDAEKFENLRGLGIGQNYPMEFSVVRYLDIAESVNRGESRTLHNSVLNLNQSQIRKIVE